MMKAIRRHPYLLRAAVTSAVVGVIGVGVVLAEDLFVNVAYVDVRKDAADFYPSIGQVKQGEKLTVIARQEDWVHVKYKDLDGWVAVQELSDKPTGGVSLAELGSSQSSGAGNANAAKGFTEDEYAKAKGYNEAPFKQWDAQYDLANPASPKLITADDIKSFMVTGKVGPKRMQRPNPT